MDFRPPLFAALLGLIVAPALAADPAPPPVGTPFSGTISEMSDGTLVVTAAGGTSRRFRLAPDVVVTRAVPASLAEIKTGDFVASAAVRGMDGKFHSTELRIFPDSMRGLGEGQHPMHDARNQTMTNATVTGTAMREGSSQLQVHFQGGDSELMVDPGVPVSRIEEAPLAALARGEQVRVLDRDTPEGPQATRVAIQEGS